MKDYSRFENLYSVSKTERFELIPIGETLAHIQADGIIAEDAQRSKNYCEAKNIIDNFHRSFIEQCLSQAKIEWKPLANTILDYHNSKNDKTDKALADILKKKRKEIVSSFKNDDRFKKLFNEKLFAEVLPSTLNKEEFAILKNFNKFSTYFTAFHENRKNIYSDEAISTAVSYRVVHQNFPKFIDNITTFQQIQRFAPEIIKQTETELQSFLDGITLSEIFSIEFYNSVLTESGISFYNTVIGGISEKGQKKRRGLNESSNLYKQQHKNDTHHYRMNTLYKQILSDRVSASFIPEAFKDDENVREGIKDYWTLLNGSEKNCLKEAEKLFDSFSIYQSDKVYIDGKKLTVLSQILFGQWNTLNQLMFAYKEAEIGTAEKSKNKKAIEKWLKSSVFSVAQLDTCIDFGKKEGLLSEKESHVSAYASQATYYIDKINDAHQKYESYNWENVSLISDNDTISCIKTYLDAIQDLYHFLEIFQVEESEERDIAFYAAFDEIYHVLSLVIPIYNKVRNYVTQKPYSEEKCKLNFKNPTLADGWDKNKEQANTSIILLKNGLYYLGIMNVGNKPAEDNFEEDGSKSDCYRKMVYKLLPGPNKMLPKVFFSKKGIETFNPPQYILDGYKQEKHKKGDQFDLDFCHRLIDYFKKVIPLYPGWDTFNFDFSPTETYEDISGFYREISEQGYKLSFINISTEKIDNMVRDNQLYLFQIYNKDFAPGTTGRPNLHTLYWKALFDEENLKDVVYKLNGEAELFYRKKSIEDPTIHKKGSFKVNKRDNDGKPIPDDLYKAISFLVNHQETRIKDEKLLPLAKEYVNKKKVRVSEVTHDIIKDKRYTEDKFFFHVPLTANFKARGTVNINRDVITYLKDNPDINIIGIDRGERHLLYLTLINQKGDILLQKTLNLVGNTEKGYTDYHQKLDQKEKDRDKARKNWQEIGKIKDMKTGYLSQIVHEISKLMVENHAIVVLENLNFGFKRGRFKVEKQVYQKFEKMLIDKLNYLVFKDAAPNSPGSIYHALQLTSVLESFQKLGRQSGFLFYVPAAYTSKIDPVTGFADFFRYREYPTIEKRHEFLSQFDSICYDTEKDAFAFKFNYDNFKNIHSAYKKDWTAYSHGERLITKKTKDDKFITEKVNPTEELKIALESNKIPYQYGENFLKNLDNKMVNPIFYALKNTMQMRNSRRDTEEDYIISPILDANGTFFDSRKQIKTLPLDADANGAYHIALKGRYLLNAINEDNKLKVENKDWFRFVQEKPYRK
jgi:CRISPR-associated protein Cpf1